MLWLTLVSVVLYLVSPQKGLLKLLSNISIPSLLSLEMYQYLNTPEKPAPEAITDLIVAPPDTGLYEVVKIDAADTQFGIVGRDHPQYIKPNSLQNMGFKTSRTFVVFNKPLDPEAEDEFSEESVIAYGIEAIHVDGYEMTCMGDDVSPKEILEGIWRTNIPGEHFSSLGERLVVCSSYRVGSLVKGAIIPEAQEAQEKPEKESKEPSTREKLMQYAGSMFNFGKQEEGNPVEEDVRENLKGEKPRTSLVAMCRDPHEHLYRDNTGRARNSMGTNYFNSYGPPAPYLAYI